MTCFLFCLWLCPCISDLRLHIMFLDLSWPCFAATCQLPVISVSGWPLRVLDSLQGLRMSLVSMAKAFTSQLVKWHQDLVKWKPTRDIPWTYLTYWLFYVPFQPLMQLFPSSFYQRNSYEYPHGEWESLISSLCAAHPLGKMLMVVEVGSEGGDRQSLSFSSPVVTLLVTCWRLWPQCPSTRNRVFHIKWQSPSELPLFFQTPLRKEKHILNLIYVSFFILGET